MLMTNRKINTGTLLVKDNNRNLTTKLYDTREGCSFSFKNFP